MHDDHVDDLKLFEKLAPFLVKLWEMLGDPTYAGNISWDEEGDSFTIKVPPEEFEKNVLPVFFTGTK
mgnify:CR=1 FL=1